MNNIKRYNVLFTKKNGEVVEFNSLKLACMYVNKFTNNKHKFDKHRYCALSRKLKIIAEQNKSYCGGTWNIIEY